MSPSDNLVSVDVDNGVATITLNRPDAGNAMSLPFVRELSAAVDRVDCDGDVRCVILTGAGRFFSVGGDIGGFREAGADVPLLLRTITGHLHGAVSGLMRMNKPVVTAINGPAAGAGLGLAIVGDVAIAAEQAHFSTAYTAIGLTPDGGTSALLPRLVGLRMAQDLLLTNRRVSAAEAVEIGLVTRSVAADQLQSEAMAVVRKLAEGPVHAFATVRRLLASGFDQPLETQLECEARAISEAAGHSEGREGISAFLQKRAPIFVPPPAEA